MVAPQATQPRFYAFIVSRNPISGEMDVQMTTRSESAAGPLYAIQTTIITPGVTNITSLTTNVINDHVTDLELAGYEVLP